MTDSNTPPFDLPRAHRWFAVEANNLAWDLLEKPDRTPAEVQRMLHAAHSAAFHWSHVGTILNTLRAECLLSAAYHAAGRAEAAAIHGQLCLIALKTAGDQATPFDRASALASAAAAFEANGRADAGEMLADARIAAAELQRVQPDDWPVLKTFWPMVGE